MSTLEHSAWLLSGAANTTELIVGSLIIAVGAVVGISLLAKPGILFGSEGSSWNDFIQSRQFAASLAVRIAGLAILGVGIWQGVAIFQKQTQLAELGTDEVDSAQSPLTAGAAAEEHDKILAILRRIAPGQYESIEDKGTKVFLWKHPSLGDIRIHTNRSIMGNIENYLDEDLEYHLEREHRARLAEFDREHPLFSYEEAKDDVVPNIFPPPTGSAVYNTLQKFDPEATAPWKNLRIVYWVQADGDRRGGAQVRRSHLRRWEKSPQELWTQSIINLNRIFNDVRKDIQVERDGNLVILRDPTSLITAYVLSKNFHTVVGHVVGGGEFYFGMPRFSTMVLLSKNHSGDLPLLIEKIEEISGETAVPLSRNVFLSTPNAIEVSQNLDDPGRS